MASVVWQALGGGAGAGAGRAAGRGGRPTDLLRAGGEGVHGRAVADIARLVIDTRCDPLILELHGIL